MINQQSETSLASDTEGSSDTATSPQQHAKPPVAISCTRGFPDWLLRNNVSLAFTSYQTGRLYLVGVNAKGQMSFHERYLARAMGLTADPQRILVSTLFQVWRFENVTQPDAGNTGAHPDRHYIPRIAHTTGDLDIHDMGIMADGRIVFVNTLYSCLATLSPTHSFRLYWKPPFISKLAAEDRCHLNGMAMKDGIPAYVTATSRSDIVNGWRDRRAEGGCLIDVRSDAILTEKLSMPHSPRWYEGRLWVLNSGTGQIGTIDIETGTFEPHAFCPGFLRGLAFHNGHAIVGLSQPRAGTFSGLALDDELKKRDADPWCGVQVVNLATGDIVEWIKLEGGVTELFDVAVIPGVRWPVATGFLNEEIHKNVTFEA
ncbi:TIGR03032 family protein [Hyphomicrobium sp.]|uniref:TIGR03032 family protein n=1 Tax=Hyphomicrobium sp. TaxID=82 RepID=UPI002D772DFE|nr:TIGR03032 family protein [Hyphomicrobium sp.]HET6391026.1 TIGR03032 family protein [Hyphomicrobium sp.]